jgi:PAS domain S-box-containing protein
MKEPQMPKRDSAKRLRESGEKLALVARETGQLIYDYDIPTGRISWDGAVQEVTGYVPAAFPSGIHDWEDMLHPDDRERVVVLLDAARRKGVRFQAEYKLRRKDGGYRRIRDVGVFVKGKDGKAMRMLGTMTDVTEWQKAEEALASSLSMLKATLESTADGILVVDKNGRVQTINRQFQDMWRIPDSLASVGDDDRLLEYVVAQPKDPEAFLSKVRWLYDHPSQESSDVLEFKDGRVFERTSKPQRIGRRIVGRVWSFRDVTKRKRAEDIRSAVYKISEIANTSESLGGLFRAIHGVICGLMPARNFYIALYDDLGRNLTFPYYVDEADEPPVGPQPFGRGLTEYIIASGEPLLADPARFLELERAGKVELVGAPSIDWLGVPLKVQDKAIGAMVVQSYTEGVRYRPEDMDILIFVSTQAALAIERKRAEETLRETERFLSGIFSSIKDGISVLDTELNILQVNAAMEKWYAHALPFKGKKCYEVYRGRKERCEVCPTVKALETGSSAFETVPMIGLGGAQTGWQELYAFPMADPGTGHIKGVIEYVRDITERKQAEEAQKASLREKEILLKEIHHRVKNNMQVISSLLSLQSRHLDDPKAIGMFKDSQHRIRSMALVHEKLYQSKDLSRIDFRQYLENLVVYLVHSYQVDSGRVRLKLDVGDAALDINTAVPCGLIVNELVTNALKHAFPGGRTGRVRVTLRPGAEGRFILTVADNGIGFPEAVDFQKTDTLGMQLVTMLVDQLDGTLTLERKRGTAFRIAFKEPKSKPRI